MPELPEVETIRRDLAGRILRQPIKEVKILSPQTVKNPAAAFIKILQDNEFVRLDRIGKLLIFALKGRVTAGRKSAAPDGRNFLLIHLKMTGQLIYVFHKKILAGGHSLETGESLARYIGGDLPNKMTRVYFVFKDGARLYFNDQRRFGYLKIVGAAEVARIKKEYGIEPLDPKFAAKILAGILKNRKKNIKAVLLDQKLLAGVGNIYADEVLFMSGIRPQRRADSLKPAEIAALAKNLPKLLNEAIKYRGTTFNNYVDAHGRKGNFVHLLKVYGREGESCVRCGGKIEKTRVAGRGTNYCPKCQK